MQVTPTKWLSNPVRILHKRLGWTTDVWGLLGLIVLWENNFKHNIMKYETFKIFHLTLKSLYTLYLSWFNLFWPTGTDLKTSPCGMIVAWFPRLCRVPYGIQEPILSLFGKIHYPLQPVPTKIFKNHDLSSQFVKDYRIIVWFFDHDCAVGFESKHRNRSKLKLAVGWLLNAQYTRGLEKLDSRQLVFSIWKSNVIFFLH